jgi:hypothetical protein
LFTGYYGKSLHTVSLPRPLAEVLMQAGIRHEDPTIDIMSVAVEKLVN